MKILWSANAVHVNSGYGVQTRHVVEGLQRLGHEVALAPTFGIQGGAVEIGGMRVYPPWREKVGQDVLGAHAKHFGADLLITLYDIWTFNADFAAGLKKPWACWFPQDSYPPCATVVERAMQADYPIAMSKFGVESMREQGVDCHYIPHGCSVDIYEPLDRAECRRELRLPEDKFIVLMVAANQSFPSRKAFPECLAAFKQFHLIYPDSLLYLHTTRKPRGQAWDGVELDILVHSLGLDDCVKFTEEYSLVLGLPDTEMAKIYNAADVLLSASMGEGFGIPIIEAQACGLPVITTKFSSMTELTFNGATVAPAQLAWTALNTWMAVPSIDSIVQALECIQIRARSEPEKHLKAAKEGRQAIIEDYSWPVVMEHWHEFLAFVESGEKPSQERKYHHDINGIEIDVWDDKLSFTTGCVAAELKADRYGLEKIDFQPGDIVLDIGAHTGLFGMYVAKRWPDVKVYSFEPSPTNYERFLRVLNPLHEQGELLGLSAWNYGVTADGHDLLLSLDRGNTGGTTEFVKPNGHLREQASSKTLDEIIREIDGPFIGAKEVRIKLLKLDCEGAEHQILTTAKCLDRIDFIAGEIHINQRLAAEGYSIEGLNQYLRTYLPAEHITTTECRMAD